jgi:excisionase family DNA binding protein
MVHTPQRLTPALKRALSAEPERFLSTEQLTAYIPFTKNAIYRLVSQRAIPHIKKGRRVIFDKKAIDKWLERDAIKLPRSA